MMKEGPVYIAAMNMNGEYIPVMLGVIRERDGLYKVGFKKVNGSVSQIFTYYDRGAQVYESEEDAQSALKALARANGWKPYEKLRRY